MDQAVRDRRAARSWATRSSNALEALNMSSERDNTALEEAIKVLDKRLEKLEVCQSAVEGVLELNNLDEDISKAFEFLEKITIIRSSALTYLNKPSGVNNHNRNFNLGSAIKFVPAFNESDVPGFFDHFEHVAASQSWPQSSWTGLIQSKFTGKAVNAYLSLSSDSAQDYQTLKAAILRAYQLIPEAYRKQFRGLTKSKHQTYVEFSRELALSFKRWCASESAEKDFDKIVNIILMEQLRNCCTSEIRCYLLEHKNLGLEQAAILADEFHLSHLDSSNQAASTSSDFNSKLNSRIPNSKPKPYFPYSNNSSFNSKKPFNNNLKSCHLCLKPGHSAFACRRFPSLESRRKRCDELSRCHFCISPKHSSENCPGKDNKLSFSCYSCNSASHSSAMCPNSPHKVSHISEVKSNDGLLLPVCNITVIHRGKKVTVPCLLDTGAQLSFLSLQALKPLNIPYGKSVSLDLIAGINGRSESRGQFLDLEFELPGGKRKCFTSFVQDHFNLSFRQPLVQRCLDTIALDEETKISPNFPSFNDKGHLQVLGLLGIDILHHFEEFSFIKCLGGSAFYVGNGVLPFGDLSTFCNSDPTNLVQVYNNNNSFNSNKNFNYNDRSNNERYSPVIQKAVNFVLQPPASHFDPLAELLPDSDVELGLENFYSLESLGIHAHDDVVDSDLAILDKFKRSIQFKNGKYVVDLPWKEDLINDVPPNYEIATAVAHRVYRKLDQENLVSQYNAVFDEQCKEGIIEPIQEPYDVNDHIWIPHRPVIKTDLTTTTKIRPVLNCSLKVNGKPSLNEAAFCGLDLMNNLLDLLLQFRSDKYTVLGDIRKAFLMICLNSNIDKNRFSFLIKKNGRLKPYRYNSIVFGFISSPFILNYILKYHAGFDSPKFESLLINRHLYVDNLIYSHSDPDILAAASIKVNDLLQSGGFLMKEWNSNSARVKDHMNSNKLHTSEKSVEKVLGYLYSVKKDQISIPPFKVDKSIRTKRQILAALASFFDPLGLFNPVTVSGKILMRDLWKLKYQWDEPLPSDILKKWNKLQIEMQLASNISFPRQVLESSDNSSLCVFCDASQEAFGCNIYAKFNNTYHLIFSKTKVAPLLTKTLPVLELLALLLGVKCTKTVFQSLPKCNFTNITFFVDAQIVLTWVLDEKPPRGLYTRNRVKQIKEVLNFFRTNEVLISFSFVPSEYNTADLLTHGISSQEFKDKLLIFLEAPSWLNSDPSSWPQKELGCLSQCVKEQLVTAKRSVSVYNNAVTDPHSYNSCINIEEFKTFNLLLRVTSLVFKAFNLFRKRVSVDPSLLARRFLVRSTQSSFFQEERLFLLNPKNGKKPPPLVEQLNLFLDEHGLIRSSGRIDKSTVFSYEIKNPLLLPRKGHLSYLVVWHHHLLCKHLGVPSTLASLRQAGFWIPKSRQFVKSVLKGCMICKRMNALAYKAPPTTSLPKHRVNFEYPFQHTGFDFTGHLWNIDDDEQLSKVYILIFTCLNTRAIHLDLVPSMNTHHFLLSFMRFVNAHSIPAYLYSDNALSFCKGGEILEQMLETSAFSANFAHSAIKHIKIPMYSAWVGATWERLIRTVKACLYKTIGRSVLPYLDLLTVLSDVQNVINSRPLTYVSSDDGVKPLTPNDFLKPYVNSSLFFNLDPADEFVFDPDQLELDLKTALNARDQLYMTFKKHWHNDYLLSLREDLSSSNAGSWVNKISAGDIVLIKSPIKTRPFWQMGRILRLIVGHDNAVRTAIVKRSDGKEALHSITHLYPLELSSPPVSREKSAVSLSSSIDEETPADEAEETCSLDSEQERSVESSGETEPVSNYLARPKRKAALACEKKLDKWISNREV